MLQEPDLKALHALISMIDEPDETVYLSLKDQVLTYEKEAVPILEQAWLAATDLLVVSRLEELMEEVNFKLIYNRMTSWLKGEKNDLKTPMLLINKIENKDFDESSYNNIIELLLKDAWLEMNENLTALEKTKVLNHIFYTVHQFNTHPDENDNVQDFFISALLDTKEGNSTSMGILYLIITQFLNLPVFGVNLPGHLILAYTDDRHLLKEGDNYNREEILFYINPFNGGAVFTENEIELYIKQVNLDTKEHYFLPADNRSIIKRYLLELLKAYKREENKIREKQIGKLLELF